MPLYFFDTDDGMKQFRDHEGIEFKDDQAARDEGSRAMAEMARDLMPGGEPQKYHNLGAKRGRDGSVTDVVKLRCHSAEVSVGPAAVPSAYPASDERLT